jgi:hypothetical protein
MSVHGEYDRALEALLTSVQRLETVAARDWAAALTQARSSQNPDLSTAAKACMRVLDSIDAQRSLSSNAHVGPDPDPLREPFVHLRAHCRAVVGTSDQSIEV